MKKWILTVHLRPPLIIFTISIKKINIMDQLENIKIYFFIKAHLSEDLSKSDIKKLASERFPKMTESDFESQYLEAKQCH